MATTRTEHRRESLRQSRNKLTAARKAAGLCKCGRVPTDGFVMCAHCREVQKTRWRKKAAVRRQVGVCGHCGKPLSRGSKCETCYVNSRKSIDRLKEAVIAAYGGKCECCGETTPMFLTIDHTNGGGATHRKSINGNFYRWLRKHGFPRDGFALLCFNCNCGRSLNGGVCPHKNHK